MASDHFGTPEDRAVLEQLRAALGDEPTLGEHVEGVAIYVYQGEITLRGVVPSQQDKQRIEERIRQAAEGRAIDSQLIVERRPR